MDHHCRILLLSLPPEASSLASEHCTGLRATDLRLLASPCGEHWAHEKLVEEELWQLTISWGKQEAYRCSGTELLGASHLFLQPFLL